MKGDPAAAYEIGVRFAEGKGVAPNLDEAAKWYDRAAQAGVVPAIFRLGTFYEKGLSVKKDVDIARRYYMQAAERGSAKAMHNLAVLDADGGGKGANYKSASQWFRKAADRGVADSQFNLGILYARGIGVEQNLAESFKWFSLAAAQGDADAGRKRDDIAKRLDAQSLAAAKLAIQTFTPEPQPDDAVNVATPAGGWDSVPLAAGHREARRQAGRGQAHRRRSLTTRWRSRSPPGSRHRRHIPRPQSRIDCFVRAAPNWRPATRIDCPIDDQSERTTVSAGRRPARAVARAAHAGRSAATGPPMPPPRRKRHGVWSVDHLRPAALRRRHPRLSRPVAARGLGLLERPVRLAEPDILGDRQGRPRRRRAGPALPSFVSGTIGPAAASWFRERLDAAHLAAGDVDPAVLARRRPEPGHDHGRDHSLARPRRPRSASPMPPAASSRPIAPAPACWSMPAARPASASQGSVLGRPSVCHDQAAGRSRRRQPSGSRARCWAI